MPKIAVVAHTGKSFGGGLGELREVLAREGVTDPLWFEVRKSRKAPKCARQALAQGAEVIFVWGGDGTVQRCINAVAGTKAAIAILPAGTANLLANNLQIPADLAEAVRSGLTGERRRFDTGSVNGEHFAVMAGAGFDARMIKEAGRGMKGRFGRAAYLYAGAKNLSTRRVRAIIDVDGSRFFKGRISCVLVGNVAKVLGGVEVFRGAQPGDGLLELGLVTAKNPAEWARALGRVVQGRAGKSPFVEVTQGQRFRIRFNRPIPYELDGGSRTTVKELRIKVHRGSIKICLPAQAVDRPAKVGLAAGWLTEVLDVGDFAVRNERRVCPAVRRLLGPDLDHPVGHHDRDDLAAALLPFGPPTDDRGTGRRQAVSPTGPADRGLVKVAAVGVDE